MLHRRRFFFISQLYLSFMSFVDYRPPFYKLKKEMYNISSKRIEIFGQTTLTSWPEVDDSIGA